MKALIMEKDRTIRYSEAEAPVPGEGEVLIDVTACGICGTDMHVYKGMDCSWALPGIIGHEFSGIVKECGPGCTGVKPGDRVTVQPLQSCGRCSRCREGRTNLCRQVNLIGGERAGGFAEGVVVPAASIVPLPAGLPIKYGALAEPAATAVHAVGRLKKDHYKVVVIKGAGAIGLLILSVVREIAETVIVSDIDTERLSIAKDLGADRTVNVKDEDVIAVTAAVSDGEMADVVFDAAGEPGGKNQVFRLLHPGAEVVFVALGNTVAEIDFTQVVTQELSIYGTQCHTIEDFDTALKLMAEGKIQYDKIVTEFPLAKGAYAFANPGAGVKLHLFP